MNKKVHIQCINHLDLIWLRCFDDDFYNQGKVIRSYSDICETVFDKWLDFMAKSDCKYSIEQSLSVKKYLERNPDKYTVIKQLAQKGQLEFLGGGESVIDYNLVNGESIVRNHLYSIQYYVRQFNCRPTVGIAPDTFGLSAQMPQIFRRLGYDSLTLYSRVFRDAKPFWRGLDGSLIYIKRKEHHPEVPEFGIGEGVEGVKYKPCSNCAGEGCGNCLYTGVDYSQRHNTDLLEQCFAEMAGSEKDEFTVIIKTEELLASDDFLNVLADLSRRYQIDYDFVTFEENLKRHAQEPLNALQTGTVNSKDIDIRREGNPVGTGGYVSRIELKKANRYLEELLLAAEKFAAIAVDFGLLYPREKIAALWSRMALLQFHDSITSTHVDAAYEELSKHIRQIKRGAGQIYHEAMQVLERNTRIPRKDGFSPFVIFNPLNWEVANQVFEIILTLDRHTQAEGAEPVLIDEEGKELTVVDYEMLGNNENIRIRVRFKEVSLPSVGFKVVYYKFKNRGKTASSSHPPSQPLQAGKMVENEFYQIHLHATGVTGIYDKELNEYILSSGAGHLMVEEDYGSPWETLIKPLNRVDLNQLPGSAWSIKQNDDKKVVTIEGLASDIKYNMNEKIRYIRYKQYITLYSGIKKIFFHTDIDWDTENMRLMVKFPLGFQPPADEAYYEIPYGILRREAYTPEFGRHMVANGDWPAVNFVSCFNQERGYCVNLFNKGLPTTQVKNGSVYLSLLRSPDIPVWLFDFAGAQERGNHCFDYMITSNSGGLKTGRVVQQGLEYNAAFLNCHAREKEEGRLSGSTSFLANQNDSIILSAIKRAEDDSGLIIRGYEPYGEAVEDTPVSDFGDDIQETSLLEEEIKPVSRFHYEPHSIKTVKIKKSTRQNLFTKTNVSGKNMIR